METEIRQNYQGKLSLTLKDEALSNDDYIGNKIENFGIIKILAESEDNTGKCLSLKVQSKINFKLYFMKKFEKKLSLGEKENFLIILKNCKHPNIIKNVSINFKDNSNILIDEYMNNGDLQDYMKTYESLNKPINEDNLWNIFFQSASSLKFLHEKDIIHRYIRLDNFLMNENKVVKLGNFRNATICKEERKITGKINKTILFQSPEMINNLEYGKKADIFSLGVVFYKLCFYDYPYSLKKKEGTFVFEPKEKKNNLNYYSNEIINIINLMIKIDEKDRPDANNLYDMIFKEYVKRLKTNTSIEAVFRCFNSFKNLSSYMIQNKISFQNEEQFPVSFIITKCFEDFIISKDKQNCSLYINNFRNILYNNGQIDNTDKEINPILILDYLLEKLHRETGGNANKNSFGIQHAQFEADKKKALEESKKYYMINYNSFIYENFAGFLKTKRICQKKEKNRCSFYSFSIFYIVISI
jgi:serine/threonine protein kinase